MVQLDTIKHGVIELRVSETIPGIEVSSDTEQSENSRYVDQPRGSWIPQSRMIPM